MIILGVETSCDETALSLIKASGTIESPSFEILGSTLFSQAHIHAEYGGVFPNLAKREHGKNLIPLFERLLKETDFLTPSPQVSSFKFQASIENILNREGELLEHFKRFIPAIEKPLIDLIAVTNGPGLEPALWVGISFAKALGKVWGIPVVPTNHMEGHIISVLINTDMNKPRSIQDGTSGAGRAGGSSGFSASCSMLHASCISFPAIALLISGGHTELIKINEWGSYELIGMTRDDAVGEAFDKVARMLDLPYPGGPHISKLAEEARADNLPQAVKLPRPMISTDDYAFSFSGLKTAVLYTIRDLGELTDEIKKQIAREFEDAVADVLITKTKKALEEFGAETLIIGGGVVANSYLRSQFEKLATNNPHIKLFIPNLSLSTDNAVMIAAAGYITHLKTPERANTDFKALGNLRLE